MKSCLTIIFRFLYFSALLSRSSKLQVEGGPKSSYLIRLFRRLLKEQFDPDLKAQMEKGLINLILHLKMIILRENTGPPWFSGQRASRGGRRPQAHLAWMLLLASILGSALSGVAGLGAVPPPGFLIGVGYREQELQTAKGSQFSSEEATGVLEASFGGGTSIFIKGTGFDLNPQSNLIDMHCAELDRVVPAPLLTEDDSFGSHPQLGTLAYKLPSIPDLFRMPESAFVEHDTLHFTLMIRIQGVKSVPMKCKTLANCKVRYVRSYSPILYKVMPRVVFQGAQMETWFDPKNVMNLISDLDTDEKPFVNFKLDESLLDYTDTVSSDTPIYGWTENRVRGIVGDLPNGKHDIRMTWETGYASILNETAMHCSYDQTDCYLSKTVPVIDSMSAHSGYLNGEQSLTVKGFGFATGKIDAKLDGVTCAVSSFSDSEFLCKVGKKETTSSVGIAQLGASGVTHTRHSSADLRDDEVIETVVVTETQSFNGIGDGINSKYRSWFVPPVTSYYRFQMYCDDRCELRLGRKNMQVDDPTLLIDINAYTGWFDYYKYKDKDGKYVQFSDWVKLTKGQYYYMEYNHIEGTGGDMVSLAVEIMKEGEAPAEGESHKPVDQRITSTYGQESSGSRRLEEASSDSTPQKKLHHSPRYEVQQISLQAETRFERTFVKVTSLNGPNFKMVFQKTSSSDKFVTDFISPKDTASQFKDKVKKFFSQSWNSEIYVYRAIYNADGVNLNETEASLDDAASCEYEIVMRRMIDGQSASVVQAVGNSAVQITKPVSDEKYTSLKPYSGKMRVKCVDKYGKVSHSDPFDFNSGANTVEVRIMQGCNSFVDRVQVRDTNRHVYTGNGREFVLSFTGYDGDPGQFELELAEDNFHFGMGGQTKEVSTLINYSHDHVFYEPIPFEMLRTYVEKPQLEVNVDGHSAVCRNVDCDFAYQENKGEVASFTYDTTTQKVVISGTELPSKLADVQKIEFAKSTCSILKRESPLNSEDGDSATHFISASEIQCTLDREPTCGHFSPIITSIYGTISLTSSLSKKQIDCTFSAVSPTKALNLLGEDVLTLTGTNLPWDTEDNQIYVKFSDAPSASCLVSSTTTDSIVCETTKFPLSSASQEMNLLIEINGLAITPPLSLTGRADIEDIVTLSPSSASPVLKTKITIGLQSTFEHALIKEDFTVRAISRTNSSYIRYLNVVEVDDTAKTLTCLFGGAQSGEFDLKIKHAGIGLIGAGDFYLDVGAEVTSVSSNSISPFGGTEITITGKNFGKEITDNPVQISYNGGVGSTDCFLTATSTTEITCRVDTGIDKTEVESATLVVFLKTSEEAKCDSATTCKVNFLSTSSLPSITAANLKLNANKRYEIALEGTNFGSDTENTKMRISGVWQITTEVTSTTARFEISNTTDFNITGEVEVIFPQGVPAGHEKLKALFEMTPKFTKVTPNAGSIAGSEIIVTVEGVGVDTEETFELKAGTEKLCSKLEVVSYSQLKCTTKAGMEVAENTVLTLSGKEEYTCASADSSTCSYSQVEGGNFPIVTALEKVASTSLKITGTGLSQDSTVKTKVSLAGIEASSIDTSSIASGVITAVWDLGFPVLAEATSPVVFQELEGGVKHFAKSSLTVESQISVSSTSTGLTCSYAGGCHYEVNAAGLSTVISKNPEENSLSVCDSVCKIEKEASTSEKFVCQLPELSTVSSNSRFGIKQETHNLQSGRYFGSGTDPAMVFDDKVVEEYESTSSECHVGMEFRANHVGVISQVKYFMGDIDDKQLYAGFLKFQGSADKAAWTDIFVADINIHEGWNKKTWDDVADYPKYRYYRFFSTQSFGCNMREVKFRGIETIEDNNEDFTCPVKLVLGGQDSTESMADVTYKHALTPFLTSVEPRYGSVEGNTPLTFSGENFPTDHSKIKVLIDGRECAVTGSTSTSISCTTADRPGIIESSMEIMIEGQGKVSNNGVLFQYVSFWSADSTWGGEFAPMELESVWIPKGLNLLVDVMQTPKLKAIVVEGSLIFYPDEDEDNERFFNAHYIFVNGGTMEVGTEKHPYTSKLTITMHSKISDPYLPIYGNKVIGLRAGTLDLHGKKREPTWTNLESTANAGSNEVTIRGEVDWKAGDEVGIASSNYDGREAEKRTITKLSRDASNNVVLTLDKALKYKHLAYTETPDPTGHPNDKIDLRAEIGLLTRNVVYRGSPDDSRLTQYGANMFLHSEGDESLIARIENIELFQVGQAFKVGRYAIHYHMIGTVHKSYVKGISVHESYNRMTTLHAIEYLTIDNNVGFDIMGHAIFMEDGVERKNYISNNLIMMVKRSWSLLNTDQTPAAFWLTNPDNNLVGNHAAGSDRYGFWYDLQIHAIGPSANTDICPENERAGENRNNHAHSVGRYGLRIFHNMVSREKPCEPVPTFDPLHPEDPYHENRPYTNDFRNFTGWKNGRNCAIAKDVSDIRFHDFKCADNLLAGAEISVAKYYNTGEPQIRGGVFIGQTSLNDEELIKDSSPKGIITARTENFAVDGAHFYNYNWKNAAAFGTCSHCIMSPTRDDGGRQHNVSNLYFHEPTVTMRIKYTIPFKAIFYDKDGTLTGLGPRTWATYDYPHLTNQKECTLKKDLFDGVICDSTQRLRRITFYRQVPIDIFFKESIFVLPYDDELIDPMTAEEKDAYIKDRSKYGEIKYTKMGIPGRSTVPVLLTGHKYKLHWSDAGIDFESMRMLVSQNWEPDDQSVYIVHNFTDQRAAMEVMVKVPNVDKANNKVRLLDVIQENMTIPKNWKTEGFTGYNEVLNDTETRELHFIINGRNKRHQMDHQISIFTGQRCIGQCLEPLEEEKELETTERLWSKAASWEGGHGKVPEEGDEVEIKSGWNMIYDLEGESPVLASLTINGKLTFLDGADRKLNSKIIFVRAGELEIGTKEKPFMNKAEIILTGDRNDKTLAFDNNLFGSNKVLANIGKVSMYGESRGGYMTRLKKTVYKGDTMLRVEPWLDIRPGDALALVSQTYTQDKTSDVTVKAYNPKLGLVTLNEGVEYYHWGQLKSTEEKYGFDIRCEVILLTRNIRIVGSPGNYQGGHVITADITEFDSQMELVERHGQMFLDNVELYNCSQVDSLNAAVRFEGAIAKPSSITNCAIHHGLGWGAKIWDSKQITFKGNSIYYFTRIGITFDGVESVTFDDNIVARILERVPDEPRGGVLGCTYKKQACSDLQITNNIVAGACFGGFTTRGHDCGAQDTQQMFRNNTAHSVIGSGGGYGVEIEMDLKDSHKTCFAGSHFNTYKNTHQGLASYQRSKKVMITNVRSMDNKKGFTAALAVKQKGESSNFEVEISDSHFFGETEIEDCPISPSGEKQGFCYKTEKLALLNAQITENGKPTHAVVCELPFYKQWSANAWNLKATYKGNTFAHIRPKTREGKKQAAIGFNDQTWDVIFIHEFYDTKFIDVEEGGLAYLRAPPKSWAVLEICGNFPCTGPWNAIFNFKDSTFEGKKPKLASLKKEFQIISNNPGISPFIPTCEKNDLMNAWVCTQDKLGLLMFESLDHDRLSRASQPIFVAKQGTKINNKLNAFKDHNWDGFYNKQERLQRFPAMVYAPRGSVYDITYTGSPASNQTYKLMSLKKGLGMTVRIAYPSAEARQIKIKGKYIAMNQWDEKIKNYGPIKQRFCGENRYIGVKNILEFYLNPGCELNIFPRNAIQTLVRMEWTMEEFFDDGGTTRFIDRLAGSLGIHASTIKVVSVYQGSLVVNYEIEADSAEALAKVEETQTKAFASGGVNLGAPVLDVASGSVSIISDGIVTAPGYAPVIITATETNAKFGGPGDKFEPIGVETESENITSIIKEEVLVNNTDGSTEIVYTEVSNTISTVIVTSAIMCLVFVLGIAAYKYYAYQKEKDLIDAKIIRENHKAYDQVNDMSVIGGGFAQDPRFKTMELSKQALEMQAQQYDPTTDFGVFGMNDQGISVKAKQNRDALVVDRSQNASSLNPAASPSINGLTIPGCEPGSHASSTSQRSPEGSSSGALSPNPLIEGRASSASQGPSFASSNSLPEDRELESRSDVE